MSRQLLGQTPCTFGSPRSVAFQSALGDAASMIGEQQRINNLNQHHQTTTNYSHFTPDKHNFVAGVGFVEKRILFQELVGCQLSLKINKVLFLRIVFLFIILFFEKIMKIKLIS